MAWGKITFVAANERLDNFFKSAHLQKQGPVAVPDAFVCSTGFNFGDHSLTNL